MNCAYSASLVEVIVATCRVGVWQWEGEAGPGPGSSSSPVLLLFQRPVCFRVDGETSRADVSKHRQNVMKVDDIDNSQLCI